MASWLRNSLLALAASAGLASFASAAHAQSASTQPAPSEETIAFFRTNCASCHTIGGGRLAGPDLKDVTQRRDRDWLLRYVPDPKATIDSGDAYAQKLLQDARGVVMPTLPGITRDRVNKLIDLVEAESKLPKSQFAGTLVSDRPLTDADVALGAQLFRGAKRFAAGAPPCITCHTTAELGGLGGGRLGPDLTTAYSRLEGRKAVAAWLSSPPSLTMQPVFKKAPLEADEVLALVAYLKSVAEQGVAEATPPTLSFVLAGCGGAGLVLFAFDFLWRRRFRAVRRPLVEQASR